VSTPDASRPLTVRVAGAAQLKHGESTRFVFKRGPSSEEGFVLRYHESLHAFANSCPHWGVDLDYGSGDFYDVSVDRLVCRTHGALFLPQTGFCDWGPCTGHSLERFELIADGDDVDVRIPWFSGRQAGGEE
jgi:nitrite reductase/ring-hydroxylating ferredoxin subunit